MPLSEKIAKDIESYFVNLDRAEDARNTYKAGGSYEHYRTQQLLAEKRLRQALGLPTKH